MTLTRLDVDKATEGRTASVPSLAEHLCACLGHRRHYGAYRLQQLVLAGDADAAVVQRRNWAWLA